MLRTASATVAASLTVFHALLPAGDLSPAAEQAAGRECPCAPVRTIKWRPSARVDREVRPPLHAPCASLKLGPRATVLPVTVERRGSPRPASRRVTFAYPAPVRIALGISPPHAGARRHQSESLFPTPPGPALPSALNGPCWSRAPVCTPVASDVAGACPGSCTGRRRCRMFASGHDVDQHLTVCLVCNPLISANATFVPPSAALHVICGIVGCRGLECDAHANRMTFRLMMCCGGRAVTPWSAPVECPAMLTT